MTRRILSLGATVVLAAAGAAAQAPAARVVRPNAVIHSVADLDRSIAFYRDAVGLTPDPSPDFPSGSSRELGVLTRAPGATLRAATLRVPGGDVRLTLVQFSGVDARPVHQRLQDPGSVKLVLRVKDMDAAFARVRDRVAAIYTEGGAPIRPEGPAAVNRAVIMRDPDGYPLEFAFQGGPVSADVPASSIVIGGWATFIVNDVAATLGFYRDRLGFQPTGAPSTLAPAVLSLQGAPTATGSMSAGVKPPGAAATWRMYDFRNVERAPLAGRLQDPGTPAVSFLVENVQGLLATLRAAGVTVDTEGGEAVNVGGTLRAFIRDPNGLLIELVEAGVPPGPRAQAGTPAAPVFKVDPFWPQWLPNRWSMQQVTGIGIDPQNDHVWFINRAAAANPDEIGGDQNKIDCCIRGPEIVELDQDGAVVRAWGGPGYIPEWPTALQTVIADSKGFIWVSGTAAQDSILKFTKDGRLVWDFGHRPPKDIQNFKETNQMTDYFVSKGRFQLDEVANEIYVLNQRRVIVYDMTTGAFKRGWGGHGMPLSEITNDPLPTYKWTGGPPPDEKNLVPDLHFVEISKDRKVYVGERGQNRIEVFTTEGRFLQEFYVSPNTPSQRAEDCGGLYHPKFPPCGTTYKLALSRDPQQKYLYVADGTNDKVWILDRPSGTTIGSFGRNGTYAGQFHWINAIAIDSTGQPLHG